MGGLFTTAASGRERGGGLEWPWRWEGTDWGWGCCALPLHRRPFLDRPRDTPAGSRGPTLRPALLLQTANGNVEAKVVCFYRRRDISSALIALADKHASESCPFPRGWPRALGGWGCSRVFPLAGTHCPCALPALKSGSWCVLAAGCGWVSLTWVVFLQVEFCCPRAGPGLRPGLGSCWSCPYFAGVYRAFCCCLHGSLWTQDPHALDSPGASVPSLGHALPLTWAAKDSSQSTPVSEREGPRGWTALPTGSLTSGRPRQDLPALASWHSLLRGPGRRISEPQPGGMGGMVPGPGTFLPSPQGGHR